MDKAALRSFCFLSALALLSVARAQSYPPAWNSAAHYAIGDQVQAAGNVYRAIKAVSSAVNPAADYTDWELSLVSCEYDPHHRRGTVISDFDHRLELRS
jgi:hypothetical protein